MLVSKVHNLNVFDVLKEDKNYVIMLINYFIEKGQTTETETDKPSHVDDGFWDF